MGNWHHTMPKPSSPYFWVVQKRGRGSFRRQTILSQSLKMNLTLSPFSLAISLFQYLDIQKFNCNKWRSIQTCIFSYLSLSSGYCVSGKLWPASRYFIHTFQNSEIKQMDKWKSAILVVAMNNEREFLTIKVLDN